jgi:hypothetical protein
MRALSRARLPLVLCCCGLTIACAGPSATEPNPVSVTVGDQQVRLVPPAQWERFEFKDEIGFRHDIDQILLRDSGPITADGIKAQVEQARQLFRTNQIARSSELINSLSVRPLFSDQRRWKLFEESWKRLRWANLGENLAFPDRVEQAYTAVLVELATLPAQDLSLLAKTILADIEPMDRREIATEQPIVVDGRRALRFDTWDRRNHTWRRRSVYIENDGRILVVRMGLGQFENLDAAFDRVVESVRFDAEAPGPPG